MRRALRCMKHITMKRPVEFSACGNYYPLAHWRITRPAKANGNGWWWPRLQKERGKGHHSLFARPMSRLSPKLVHGIFFLFSFLCFVSCLFLVLLLLIVFLFLFLSCVCVYYLISVFLVYLVFAFIILFLFLISEFLASYFYFLISVAPFTKYLFPLPLSVLPISGSSVS